MADLRTSRIVFREFIPKEKERTYYERPFSVPEGVCRLDVAYEYRRYEQTAGADGQLLRSEINTVDLALRDGRGNYLGASGAGKDHVFVSGWESTPGYVRADPDPGQWAVIVGAYRIAPEGVEVTYTVTFTYGGRQLLVGDTHVHTTASDGALSAADAVGTARAAGLDYVFLTDHNGYAHNLSLPEAEGITVLPGSEWTHYNGHAGMLGVSRPLESAFCVNSDAGVRAKLAEARHNGALLVLNHPFCPSCGWHFRIDGDDFDLVEAVNGGTAPQANEACVRWWHQQLCLGSRWRIVGGSDFHRMEPGGQIGQPATAVYALSRSPRDILAALRRGNSYIVLWPKGPVLRLEAGDALLGDAVPAGTETAIALERLREGDRVRLLTDIGEEELTCGRACAGLSLRRRYPGARFVRVEVWRRDRRILLSNPLFFT